MLIATGACIVVLDQAASFVTLTPSLSSCLPSSLSLPRSLASHPLRTSSSQVWTFWGIYYGSSHCECARRMGYIRCYACWPVVFSFFAPYVFCPFFATGMTPFLHWPAASGGFPRSQPPRHKKAQETTETTDKRDTARNNGNTDSTEEREGETETETETYT